MGSIGAKVLVAPTVETRFFTSDSHGLLTGQYWLLLTQTSLQGVIGAYGAGNVTAYFYVQVWVRHADGSKTLVQDWYLIGIRDVDGEGYQSKDWSCPETPINTTDAILIITKCVAGTIEAMVSHFTEQLGGTKLNSATWTFTLYTRRLYRSAYNDTSAEFYFGIASKNSKIVNFTWTG
jgi:hypothetical protein